ncbi:MAG: RNA signal recognition particle [Waddliaceae bacterium]|nr:RNA signal recognition particle [Waddliaceae bacterium]
MYIDGFVTPVPKVNKEKYIEHLKKAWPFMKEFGVSRMVETWQDDVPRGKKTDFFRAVDANEDEAVLFSWFEWPSKEIRDEGIKKMMADPRMEEFDMPFDGTRMIFGGFEPIFES